jgi:hypothetical protein
LPNDQIIQATHFGFARLHPSLSQKASRAHVFDGITNSSLLSIGQLCDNNCVAILDKKQINIYKQNTCVLLGTWNLNDGLWDIPVPTAPTAQPQSAPPTTQKWVSQSVNAIIRRDKTKTELAQFLHGCCGSPAITTWARAIKNGNFLTWPGIDDILLTKHLPPSIATAKGHLDQERKNLRSTKQQTDTNMDDFFPVNSNNIKTYDACVAIIPFATRNTAYQDLTGRFPHTSSRGNQYILVVYDYDSNAILHNPLKNKQHQR